MRLKMLDTIPQIDGGVRWLFHNEEIGTIAIDEDKHGKRERMSVHGTRVRGAVLDQAFAEAERMLASLAEGVRAAYQEEE